MTNPAKQNGYPGADPEADAQHTFPVFEGDMAHWQRDMDILRAALEQGEGYEYDAQLPEIIGYLSPEEAALLAELPDGLEVSISDDEGTYGIEDIEHLLPAPLSEGNKGLVVARYLFPDLLGKIESDVAITTGEQGRIKFVELEKKRTMAGEVAKGSGHLHVDDMVGRKEDVLNTHYLIANGQPTLFYEGKAKLFKMRNGRLFLDTDSLETDGSALVAPPPALAIVRTNGTTVHGSPRFETDFSRAWFRVSSGLAA
jgi:hypothetical protein